VFDRLKRLGDSVRRTRDSVFGQVADLFDRREVDDNLWLELEELLIRADVGFETTQFILDETEAAVERKRIKDGPAARDAFKDVLVGILNSAGPTDGIHLVDGKLTTVLIVGVNGVGKTTSIGKLINTWKKQGHRPIVAAADTFRAAASDQLKIWADRAGVPIVSHQPGADPGAVVFDAWQAAQSRKADVLVVDTAGRLHTKFNLMEELRKIYRVLAKQDPAAPDATLLVLDATTGQNALTQAKEFKKAANVTGLILTKIDGTAKGGCVFPIVRELKVPILYLGSGEQIDDLEPFDARAFVEALLTEKVPR
jgi:fused signal recognition particle receptor